MLKIDAMIWMLQKAKEQGFCTLNVLIDIRGGRTSFTVSTYGNDKQPYAEQEMLQVFREYNVTSMFNPDRAHTEIDN